jgi:hypothetical protein
MNLSPFDVVQKMLHLDNKPFDLSDRPYLKALYNTPCKRNVYRFSRQCEKSSTIAAKMAMYGSIIPGFKSLYVSPVAKQTRVFSTVRLKEFLDSPFIRKNLIDKTCAEAVFFKELTNKSKFFLEYAFLTPDRCRGISADWVLIDEIQDFNHSYVPVIEESATHSKYKYFTYAGTPKTMENTIEYYFEKSTQRELCIKCQHCNHWQIGLGLKNIGQDGLICEKCERNLERTTMEWVRGVPLEKSIYEGWHLNALCVPWTDWKEILVKRELYSPQRFHNEVLGLPFDNGLKPITMSELISSCKDRLMAEPNSGYSSPLIAGVDWSVTSDVSDTVLTIGEFMPYPSKFRIHYMKIYPESMADPREQVKDIIDICRKFNVSMIGADWGAGSVTNLSLVEAFGMGRVVQFFHTGNQQERIKFNKKRFIYTTNRTFVMADLFNDFIKGKIELFNWDQFKPFANQILNIYQDVREMQQKETLYYDHRPDKKDDAFHSILFCRLAADIFYAGRPV